MPPKPGQTFKNNNTEQQIQKKKHEKEKKSTVITLLQRSGFSKATSVFTQFSPEFFQRPKPWTSQDQPRRKCHQSSRMPGETTRNTMSFSEIWPNKNPDLGCLAKLLKQKGVSTQVLRGPTHSKDASKRKTHTSK